ncbi:MULTISPECIES: AAC(3) family N-acetyltransferase [Aeromonas]|uniref:AAC(3) family N-acetyltransferase n=1 Tax=Aeromonas TaxID=642 RepID=UPI00191CED45|nr:MULTISPECIES: AAC(3) family N-acetyltransferase [Aeromonas]MBL0504903.1 AAC(3) family N-acetyltransferase [Aeromonas veronii]WAG08450.1 AAC(3) family N-acetyltransferase [Aeromonas jandaei]
MIEALSHTLSTLGIARGSALMVHSDAMAVAQFPGQSNNAGMHAFWSGIQEWLGDEGTLLVPTFTYSLTRQVCFDRVTSPSEVGLMTELFRTLPDVRRTRDPIFSMAVWGVGGDEIITAGGHDCFGQDSPFAWLAAHDGWIAGFACHPDRITFTHYVEQQLGIDYRFMKRFEGEVCDGGAVRPWYCDYFVRKLDLASEIDLSRLVEALKSQNKWHQGLFGRLPVWAVRCADFAAVAKQLIAEHPHALIREGA